MWEISFANLNMLLATIPTYEPEDEKEKVDKVDSLSDIFKDP